MSYSFSVIADTKAEAKQKIADSFANVVNGQPSHAADQAAVVACGQAFVDLLADPQEGDEIYVNMYGSLSWHNDDVGGTFLSGGVTVNASLRNKVVSN